MNFIILLILLILLQALETLRSQNESLVVIDMRDDKLVDILRQAITKGQEVCVVNFSPDYSEHVKVRGHP